MLGRNGRFTVAENPYMGPPPLYTSLVLGPIGGVVVALLGLFRWKKSSNQRRATEHPLSLQRSFAAPDETGRSAISNER